MGILVQVSSVRSFGPYNFFSMFPADRLFQNGLDLQDL